MRTSLEQHLASRQVGRVIYGSIIGMALIVALEAHPPSAGVMTVWLLGTAVAVGLAEVYSEVVGLETRARRPVTRAELGGMAEDAAAVGFGVAFCGVFFLLSAVGVTELEFAFTLAKWTNLGLIGFYGYWAASFAGARRPRAVFKGALVALVGFALIILKSFVH